MQLEIHLSSEIKSGCFFLPVANEQLFPVFFYNLSLLAQNEGEERLKEGLLIEKIIVIEIFQESFFVEKEVKSRLRNTRLIQNAWLIIMIINRLT